jgi:hypothetical protein
MVVSASIRTCGSAATLTPHADRMCVRACVCRAMSCLTPIGPNGFVCDLGELLSIILRMSEVR